VRKTGFDLRRHPCLVPSPESSRTVFDALGAVGRAAPKLTVTPSRESLATPRAKGDLRVLGPRRS